MKKLCRQMLTVTALGIAGLMFTAQRAAWAGDDEIAPSFTPQQREEIKNLVTSQIAAHPEIVVEALKQMENLKQQQHRALVEQVGRQLRDPQRSPSLGKPDSKHYVMEFFDFNCGYCKYMEPFMKEVRRHFEYVDKEEILKKVVAREFGHFLKYYANAPKIEEVTLKTKKKGKGSVADRGGHPDWSQKKPREGVQKGYVKLYVNLGRQDRFFPGEHPFSWWWLSSSV